MSRLSLLQRHDPDLNRDRESNNSILLTWQISFERVLETRKSAANLLSVMSFCDRVAIPATLLLEGVENNDSWNSEFEKDVAVLRSFSFISETAAKRTWEMHRLVQDAMLIWLNAQNVFEKCRDIFIHCLDESLLDGYENSRDLRAGQRLFPHAKIAAQYRPASRDALLEWASIMHKSSLYLNERGDHIEALEMARASKDVRTAQLEQDNELTARSLNMMAMSYWLEGQFQEAENFPRMALGIKERVLGAEDPSTLHYMDNLGLILRDSNQLEEAEILLGRVYKISQAKFGEEHLETTHSLVNLATMLGKQER